MKEDSDFVGKRMEESKWKYCFKKAIYKLNFVAKVPMHFFDGRETKFSSLPLCCLSAAVLVLIVPFTIAQIKELQSFQGVFR